MDKVVETFLTVNRISVLSILQEHSQIHSATLHYAYQQDPLHFFFMTEKTSEKCRSLLDGSSQPAALVIGFQEKEFVTYQAAGKVSIINDPDKWNIYITKFPSLKKGPSDPKYVLLQFTPDTWKYSDMNTDPIIKLRWSHK